MEGKTGRTKGKENTCRTVGITKALADSGHSTTRKGFFYFFALKFGYSIETKNPNASPIRKVFGLFVCGRSDWTRTSGLLVPNQAHYQAVQHPDILFCDPPRLTVLRISLGDYSIFFRVCQHEKGILIKDIFCSPALLTIFYFVLK